MNTQASERSWRRFIRRYLRRYPPNQRRETAVTLIDALFEYRLTGSQVLADFPDSMIQEILSDGIDAAGIIHEVALQTEGGSIGIVYTPLFIARVLAAEVVPVLRDGEDCLDPACGCGNLLVEVYRVLVKENPPAQVSEANALLARLHGWDIDAEAVDIATRNLVLTAWESLAIRQPEDLDRLKAPNVRVVDALHEKNSSFRAIIGNPPYIPEEGNRSLHDAMRKDPRWSFRAEPRMDYGQYFVHLAIDLLEPGGRMAFILPATWRTADGAKKLRQRLKAECYNLEIQELQGVKCFPDTAPGQQNMLLSATRSLGPVDHKSTNLHMPSGLLGDYFDVRQGIVPGPDVITRKALRTFEREDSEGYQQWRKGMEIDPGMGVFVLTREEVQKLNLLPDEISLLRPFFRAADLANGKLPTKPCRFILYMTRETAPDIDTIPNIRRHLEPFRLLLERRRETRLGMRAWYHLHWPRDVSLFEDETDPEKILVVRQTPRMRAVWTDQPAYVDISCNVIRRRSGAGDLRRLADLLNSDAVNAWFFKHGKRKGDILQIDGGVLRRFPYQEFLAGNG